MNRISVLTHIKAHNINSNYFAFHVLAVGQEFILVRVLGVWISWSYNLLSQTKAEAETEFGKTPKSQSS